MVKLTIANFFTSVRLRLVSVNIAIFIAINYYKYLFHHHYAVQAAVLSGSTTAENRGGG